MGRFPNRTVFLNVLFAVMGTTLRFGFNITLINPMGMILNEILTKTARTHYHWDLEDPDQAKWRPYVFGATGGALALGSIIGSLTYGYWVNRVGRRQMLLLVQIMFMVFSVMAILTHYDAFELFFFSQLFSGVFLAYGIATTTTFIAEVSDPSHASFLNSLVVVSIEVGTATCNLLGINVIFGNEDLWPLLIFAPFALNFVCFFGVLLYGKETPHSLLQQGDRDAAVYSIQYYADCSIEEAEEKVKAIEVMNQSNLKLLSVRQVLRNPKTRKPLLLTACLGAAQVLSGVIAMGMFGTSIFVERAHLTRTTAGILNFGLTTSFLMGVFIALFFLTKISHRILLLVCLPVLALCNATYAGCIIYAHSNPDTLIPAYGIAVALFIFGLFFSNSLEKIGFFCGALITPREALPATASTSVLVLNTTAFIIPPIFAPLLDNFHGYAFIPFVVTNIGFWVIFLLFYPKKTLMEQMSAEALEDVQGGDSKVAPVAVGLSNETAGETNNLSSTSKPSNEKL
ncbi:unnamed protein product [Bursaphelenchus xylophilus]|uniref:(pine wood nematode) hypothetical protein n=1 Tax=Bursaphelenchus xylophilus TaxID=6326 RepID=A0A1I7S4L4_BURXY|nr:unnamed protein product [Bursaphelenchus xylophilus]CAG9117219.1 unnamed protein product [Bursaphelenchus xylophilus]